MITIEDVKEKISLLPTTSTPNAPIQQRVEESFRDKVKTELTRILNIEDESSCYLAIENYLKDIWNFIKGTCLCYTSTPSSDITKVLCDLADIVAAYKNTGRNDKPFTAIQILMPGLLLEANHNDYYDLAAIARCRPFDSDLDNRLQLLESEIAHAKLPDENLLFNTDEKKTFQQKLERWEENAPLNETTDINHYLKDFFTNLQDNEKVHKILALQSVRFKQKKILESIKTQSAIQETQIQSGKLTPINTRFLQANYRLQHILSTHIISSSQRDLIPITSLLKENSLKHPYGDSCTENICSLSADEHRRLNEHSPNTRMYSANLKKLEELEENKTSLYDHLLEFINQLKFNGAHSGTGTQEHAGSGAFEAIRIFYEYYDSLGYQITNNDRDNIGSINIQARLSENKWQLGYKIGRYNNAPSLKGIIDAEAVLGNIGDTATSQSIVESSKDKKNEILHIISDNHDVNLQAEAAIGQIPQDVRSKLDYLKNITTDAQANIDATPQLKTCIASRAEELEPLARAHKEKLKHIAVTDSQIVQVKTETEQSLDRIGSMINEILLNQQSTTKEFVKSTNDDLPITRSLLSLLGEESRFNTIDNIKALLRLDEKSIDELCRETNTKRDIINYFSNNVAELSWAIMDDRISAKQWEVALIALSPEFFRYVINDSSHIKVLLWNNNGDKLRMIVKHLVMYNKLNFCFLHESPFNGSEKLKQILSAILIASNGSYGNNNSRIDEIAFLVDACNAEPLRVILDTLKISDVCHCNNKKNFFNTNPELIQSTLKKLTPEQIFKLFTITDFDTAVVRKFTNNPEILKVIHESIKVTLEKSSLTEAVDIARSKFMDTNTLLEYTADNTELLELILNKVPAENIIDCIRSTTGIINVVTKNLETSQILLRKLNADDTFEVLTSANNLPKDTTLHMIANYPETLKVSLEKLTHAQILHVISLQNKNGETALHKAAKNPQALAVILEKLTPEETFTTISIKTITSNYHMHMNGNNYFNGASSEYTMLHLATENPESLKVVLDKLPEDKILETILLSDKQDETVLQEAAINCESLKIIICKLTSINDFKPVTHNEETLNSLTDVFLTVDDYFSIMLGYALRNPESLELILETLKDADILYMISYNFSKGDNRTRLPTESLKVILDTLTPEETFTAVTKDCAIKKTVLHIACPEVLEAILKKLPERKLFEAISLALYTENSESLALILNNYTPEYILEAVKLQNNKFSETVLHTDNSQSVIAILDKLPKDKILDAISLQDNKKRTVLHKAHPRTLKHILEKLTPEETFTVINLKDINSETVLHRAYPDLLEDILKKVLARPQSQIFATTINRIKYILEVTPESNIQDTTKSIMNALSGWVDATKYKLINCMCDLITRKTEYYYWGFFQYTGAYSKTDEINAITRFLINEEPLNTNDLGALSQGNLGSIINSCPASLERLGQAKSSLEKK